MGSVVVILLIAVVSRLQFCNHFHLRPASFHVSRIQYPLRTLQIQRQFIRDVVPQWGLDLWTKKGFKAEHDNADPSDIATLSTLDLELMGSKRKVFVASTGVEEKWHVSWKETTCLTLTETVDDGSVTVFASQAPVQFSRRIDADMKEHKELADSMLSVTALKELLAADSETAIPDGTESTAPSTAAASTATSGRLSSVMSTRLVGGLLQAPVETDSKKRTSGAGDVGSDLADMQSRFEDVKGGLDKWEHVLESGILVRLKASLRNKAKQLNEERSWEAAALANGLVGEVDKILEMLGHVKNFYQAKRRNKAHVERFIAGVRGVMTLSGVQLGDDLYKEFYILETRQQIVVGNWDGVATLTFPQVPMTHTSFAI